MNKHTFLSLLTKQSAVTLTEKEKLQLENALLHNHHFQLIYNEFMNYMSHKSYQTVNTDIENKLDELWKKIEQSDVVQYDAPVNSSIIPLWAKIAAALLVLIGIGFSLLRINTKSDINIYTQTVVSGNENIYTVLDDGTQVWLNKNSTLAYNTNFGKEKREIKITGEAFFDVAHNPEIPLTVHTQGVDVKVKGTAFNINSYIQNKVEVALIRGLVAIASKETKKEIMLYPNQKIVMQNGIQANLNNIQVIKTQSSDTISNETKWTSANLSFTKQRLADLAKLMESRYHVSFVFDNENIKEQRFTGVITDENLIQMLEALKLSYPFTYEITGKNVVIK